MNTEQGSLFDLTDYPIIQKDPVLKTLEAPVWTENKANLIQRYLRYFVFITKHGTYIDTFAGPQSPEHPDSWAAQMVLNSEPRWLRNFAFFEKDQSKFEYIGKLLSEQPEKPKRSIQFYKGDMNENLPKYFAEYPVSVSEATFCLIDQHTFECPWKTVELIAQHKNSSNKIEIFYFLAQGWLDRAIAALKEPEEVLGKWWGNDEWKILQKKPTWDRGLMLANRFKNELGYRYAKPFPIFDKDEGGKIMFWMIHASDHPEAPKLMVRAYNKAVAPLESVEQLDIEFKGIAP